MQHKCCFFIGHRDAPKTLMPLIRDAIEEHVVNYHVTEFIVGQYGSFDRMVAKALLQAKEGHTEIKLTLLLPYYSCTTRSLSDGFDESLFPSAQAKVFTRAELFRIIVTFDSSLGDVMQQLDKREDEYGLNPFGENENVELALAFQHSVQHQHACLDNWRNTNCLIVIVKRKIQPIKTTFARQKMINICRPLKH